MRSGLWSGFALLRRFCLMYCHNQFNFHMKKNVLLIAMSLMAMFNLGAQEVDTLQLQIDALEKTFTYQTGTIELEAGNATLNVPSGFRFLDKKQSMYVLTTLWGNPADSSILGLLVPENRGVLAQNSWVYTLSYEDIGYIKDEDANDINYDDLLKDLQKETLDANAERKAQGFEPIQLIGWASQPYYDSNKKILHWAKELKFGEGPSEGANTLNYNLRVLGRKGMFMLNAVATTNELNEVKGSIDKVIGSVVFKEGSTYADFNPEVDQVAAWTIGGLVAGKVLAKAGFFVLLLKFWKVIAVAVAAGGGALWNFLKGRKSEDAVASNETKEQ